MLVDVCYAVVYQFAQTVSPWTDALKAHQSEWLSAADRLTVQFVECDVSSMVGSELCVVLLSGCELVPGVIVCSLLFRLFARTYQSQTP